MTSAPAQLGLTWTDAVLVVITALGIYVTMIVLSRWFGPRQFATSTSYDLAFTFALGSVIGRVILVRTSLAAAVLGLATLFILHAAFGRLHHSVPAIHELMQNHRCCSPSTDASWTTTCAPPTPPASNSTRRCVSTAWARSRMSAPSCWNATAR